MTSTDMKLINVIIIFKTRLKSGRGFEKLEQLVQFQEAAALPHAVIKLDSPSAHYKHFVM